MYIDMLHSLDEAGEGFAVLLGYIWQIALPVDHLSDIQQNKR